jgi:hypothetical protein
MGARKRRNGFTHPFSVWPSSNIPFSPFFLNFKSILLSYHFFHCFDLLNLSLSLILRKVLLLLLLLLYLSHTYQCPSIPTLPSALLFFDLKVSLLSSVSILIRHPLSARLLTLSDSFANRQFSQRSSFLTKYRKSSGFKSRSP